MIGKLLEVAVKVQKYGDIQKFEHRLFYFAGSALIPESRKRILSCFCIFAT
jgi:hypothetical protein